MPALENPRQEAACQARAMGKSVGEAYESVGYKRNSSAPTTFFQKPHVASRVQELVAEKYEEERKVREIATQESGVDASWIYKRLKYLTDISIQGRPIKRNGEPTGEYTKPDGATAVRCLTLAAQMGGHLVQRVELGGPGDFSRLTDEELDAELVKTARELGMPTDALENLLTSKAQGSA